jgi:hypothetical protein
MEQHHPIHIRGGRGDIDKSDLARPGSGADVYPIATEDQRDVDSPSPPIWSRQLNSFKTNSITPKAVTNAKLKAKQWRGKLDRVPSLRSSGNIVIGAQTHGRGVSLLAYGAKLRPMKRSSFEGTSGPFRRTSVSSSRRTSVSEAFFRRASIEPESIEIFHSAKKKETSTLYVLHPDSFTRRFIDLVAGLHQPPFVFSIFDHPSSYFSLVNAHNFR